MKVEKCQGSKESKQSNSHPECMEASCPFPCHISPRNFPLPSSSTTPSNFSCLHATTPPDLLTQLQHPEGTFPPMTCLKLNSKIVVVFVLVVPPHPTPPPTIIILPITTRPCMRFPCCHPPLLLVQLLYNHNIVKQQKDTTNGTIIHTVTVGAQKKPYSHIRHQQTTTRWS